MKSSWPQKYIPPTTLGCGTRRKGKPYIYSDMKKWLEHFPAEYFRFDPPVRVEEPSSWGLSPQGLSAHYQQGYWHVFDWIGESFYNFASDILEEVFFSMGSGLVPITMADMLSKLVAGKSRRFLFHPKGYMLNPQAFKSQMAYVPLRMCSLPEGEEHQKHINDPDVVCAALHWQAVAGFSKNGGRLVDRTIGDVTYVAAKAPEGIVPVYDLGLVAWTPVDEVHVIDNEEEPDEIEKTLARLSKVNGVPVFVTNA